jgi:hypothetical protein
MANSLYVHPSNKPFVEIYYKIIAHKHWVEPNPLFLLFFLYIMILAWLLLY